MANKLYVRVIADYHHDETRVMVSDAQARRILAGHDIRAELTEAQSKRARLRLCGSRLCRCDFAYTFAQPSPNPATAKRPGQDRS